MNNEYYVGQDGIDGRWYADVNGRQLRDADGKFLLFPTKEHAESAARTEIIRRCFATLNYFMNQYE